MASFLTQPYTCPGRRRDARRRALRGDPQLYLHGGHVEGCSLSAEERCSRQRVADGPWYPRLRQGKFVNATVVVANKYQINKDWAKACARDAQVCDKEIRRLQYRDMDPEGLCGMVPLAISMPVVPGPLAEVAPDGSHGLRAFLALRKENEQQPRKLHLGRRAASSPEAIPRRY